MGKLHRRCFGKQQAPVTWPKVVQPLSVEEERVKNQICLECQEYSYKGLVGWVSQQGHRIAEKLSTAPMNPSYPLRTLEIGCGSGYHFSGEGQFVADLEDDPGLSQLA